MVIGIPREVFPGERRVAATPDSVKRLIGLGFSVIVEPGAGKLSNFGDASYTAAGASVAADIHDLLARADVVLKVRPPTERPEGGFHEADLLREGSVLISYLYPAANSALVERMAARRVTALAMDCVPRISRAQKMDALSSMANISGYRAVIEAASAYGRAFMGQVTAAGKLPPAKVLVIGAGVAGLAAVGVARGLGAVVRAFDTRAAVKEQVESLGAEFLQVEIEEDGEGQGGYAKEMTQAFIDAEMALFLQQAKEVDIIITTAQIPGKKAPVLITREMVEAMRAGSVIVDMAAEAGGNCALTVAGEHVVHQGVHILGFTDLPSRLPSTSSQLYATNVFHLVQDMMGKDKVFKVDLEDEVVRGALVLHDGALMWPPPPRPVAAVPAVAASAPKVVAKHVHTGGHNEPRASIVPPFALVLGALVFVPIGLAAPAAFLAHFTVFILACFVGWQVIWNVTPALHTPLMSVTNAISGIIVIGGMLQLGSDASWLQVVLGAVAVLIASINIVGGFTVTERMLMMFRK